MKKKQRRSKKEKNQKIKIKRPVGRPRKSWVDKDVQILTGSTIESPVLESPIESPVSESPIESPVLESPIESPVSESPIESPISESLIQESPIKKEFTKEELDKLFEHDIIDDVKDLEEKDIELEKIIDSKKLSVVAFNCIAILRNKDFWNLTEKESVLAGRILDYLMVHYKDKLKPYIVIIILSSGFLTLVGSRLVKDVSEELEKKKENKKLENNIEESKKTPKQNELKKDNLPFPAWNSVNSGKY